MLKKKYFIFLIFVIIFLLNFSFFEIEKMFANQEESLIGLMVNGSNMTNFPNKDSGYAIDSIQCDKDATGVWDYESWTLKIRNITQSRTKCQINFVSKYSEGILNGTDPVLKEGLIPVMIDDNGIVHKASLGWEWYKYEDKKWANAVILNDETEVYYDGDIIPEEKIESYFVWIPRYKYKIWNMGFYETVTSIDISRVHTIEVIFGHDATTDTNDSCKTPGVSGESGTCSVGKYMTHPAFLAFDTNGMWVGKFETGYKGATTTIEAEQNENNLSKIQIKPNVYSWRRVQIANAYLSSYHYKREYDSHMMKNTEWGAVAYLQHSKYGSHTSVRINNNSSYITGYAATNEPTCGYTENNEECNKYESTSPFDDGLYTVNYKNFKSQIASTTGNYSGVYDMSGGAWEFVMGVVLSSEGIPCSGRNASENSGFNGPFCGSEETETLTDGISDFPSDTRYYDTYKAGSYNREYYRRILGDATGEMGPVGKFNSDRQIGSWYDDEMRYIHGGTPWFQRGSHYMYGTISGIFAYNNAYGYQHLYDSYRIVLSIE